MIDLMYDLDRWVTSRDMARLFNHSERTIRWWCKSGKLASFGFKTMLVSMPTANCANGSRRGRWYIKLED